MGVKFSGGNNPIGTINLQFDNCQGQRIILYAQADFPRESGVKQRYLVFVVGVRARAPTTFRGERARRGRPPRTKKYL